MVDDVKVVDGGGGAVAIGAGPKTVDGTGTLLVKVISVNPPKLSLCVLVLSEGTNVVKTKGIPVFCGGGITDGSVEVS